MRRLSKRRNKIIHPGEVEVRTVHLQEDRLIIKIAIKFFETLVNAKTKPGWKYADFDTILNNIKSLSSFGSLQVIVKDNKYVGAFAWDIISPWYSTFLCLQEIFVLKLDDEYSGIGEVALDYFKRISEENDCGLITTADALSDDKALLRNLYERKGKCDFTYDNFVWVLK